MRITWLAAAAAAAMLAPPATAQSVKAGIDAWQSGKTGAAVAIWRPLAERGNADAQFNIAQAYKLGRGVPLDLAQAQTFYERAARQGHPEAQTNLGMLLFQNGNRAAALRWLKTAADAGDARALLIYGTALFNGDGVSTDRVTAYAMVSRAAAEGFLPARTTLAEMDELIPLAERQKGVAMALKWVKPSAVPKAAARSTVTKVATPTATKAPSKAAMPAPALVGASAQGGSWRIQLGAFSQRAAAEELFRKLSAGPLVGKQPHLVPVGKMTRLQAGSYPSRAAAGAACKSLSAQGQPCFPVAGR